MGNVMGRKRVLPAGFTLIELLVVLVILGLLAGLVGPRVMRHLASAKVKSTQLQIEELGAALDIFQLETGRYPTSEEGLAALIDEPQETSGWQGPYLKKLRIPKDGWGREFVYRSPGQRLAYEIISYGADGLVDGKGVDADLVSWL